MQSLGFRLFVGIKFCLRFIYRLSYKYEKTHCLWMTSIPLTAILVVDLDYSRSQYDGLLVQYFAKYVKRCL